MLTKDQAEQIGDAIIRQYEDLRTDERNRKTRRIWIGYDCEQLHAFQPYQRAQIVHEATVAVQRSKLLSLAWLVVCFAGWFELKSLTSVSNGWFLLVFASTIIPLLLYRTLLIRRKICALAHARLQHSPSANARAG